MKANIKKLSYFFAATLLLSSCQDDINHPSQDKIPLAIDINCDININQETNEVTFSINNPGCTPVWIMQESSGIKYSTVNGYTKVYASAGTYKVEVKMYNSNGVCDGSILKEFTIENSITDYTRYYYMFAGEESKQWVIAKDVVGHLGCGPSGSEGLEWFSAKPNEKEAFGVYKDILTFDVSNKYTYDPGENGTIFVNAGCNIFPEYNVTGEDYMAPAVISTCAYNFETLGEDVYLTLDPKSYLPYIPNDDIYNNPKFRILELKNNLIRLVADNGEIAWHYTLVPYSDNEGPSDGNNGFDPDFEFNLWKDCSFTNHFFYAPGWNEIAAPELTVSGKSYTLNFPEATTDQWQNQVHFITNIPATEEINYDFSMILNSNKDLSKVTVKLTDGNSDDNFIFAETVSAKAYEDNVIIFSNIKGITADNLKLVFDFGGNPENTEVTISNIVIKDNSKDDGTGAGNGSGEDENDDTNWDSTSANNFWNTASFTNRFFYAPGWGQIADPEIKVSNKEYTVILPQATFEQWQAQVFFETDMSSSAGKNYDFRCVLNSNKNMSKATIKLVKSGNDEEFYFTKEVSLKAYEDVVVKFPKLEGQDFEKIDLVFDFGGNQENTEVTISEILFKDSQFN